MLSTPRYRPLGVLSPQLTQDQHCSFADMLDYAPNAPTKIQEEPADEKGKDHSTPDPNEDMPRERAANRVVPTMDLPSKKLQAKAQHGDPRFLGKVNTIEVQKNYAFIGDMRREELRECEAAYNALPEDTPAEEREALRRKVLALKRKIGEMNRRQAESELREKLVQAELRAVAHGKKAFFLADKEIKRITSESLYCNSIGTKKGERKLQKAYKRHAPPKAKI